MSLRSKWAPSTETKDNLAKVSSTALPGKFRLGFHREKGILMIGIIARAEPM
jgi:hypothetical protein